MKGKRRILIVMLIIAIVISMQSCSPDPVENALDNYETVVTKLEKQTVKGKKFSVNDLLQMQQQMMEGIDISCLQQKSQPTEKQKQRAIELGKRLRKLMGF